ncbi:Protocadherin Fat 1 [Manis pentadactyla]|nr:Protocadherin Fat 1 [Manis pentadactyla]
MHKNSVEADSADSGSAILQRRSSTHRTSRHVRSEHRALAPLHSQTCADEEWHKDDFTLRTSGTNSSCRQKPFLNFPLGKCYKPFKLG